MERLNRNELNIGIAKLISQRGTCERLQVGCVITMDGRLISSGYNGPLPGENGCHGICDTTASCNRAVHAEANAIYAAARNGIALKGSTIYCTHSPCTDCVEAIVQSGIIEVVFEELFRDKEPLNRLRALGIKVLQYKDGIESTWVW
jgi:dCMP deaminase